jgi:hypothetical protein
MKEKTRTLLYGVLNGAIPAEVASRPILASVRLASRFAPIALLVALSAILLTPDQRPSLVAAVVAFGLFELTLLVGLLAVILVRRKR